MSWLFSYLPSFYYNDGVPKGLKLELEQQQQTIIKFEIIEDVIMPITEENKNTKCVMNNEELNIYLYNLVEKYDKNIIDQFLKDVTRIRTYHINNNASNQDTNLTRTLGLYIIDLSIKLVNGHYMISLNNDMVMADKLLLIISSQTILADALALVNKNYEGKNIIVADDGANDIYHLDIVNDDNDIIRNIVVTRQKNFNVQDFDNLTIIKKINTITKFTFVLFDVDNKIFKIDHEIVWYDG